MTPPGLGLLDDLPSVELAHKPTPIEDMPNLSDRIGGARLCVKRDDCTGLAFGGNKARQLERYLGDALSDARDTIVITGAVQSNFVRSAAAAARKLGLECHVQLEDRVPRNDPAYRNSGNVLLDRLLGATVHEYPAGEDEAGADRRLAEIAAGLQAAGRRPYVIPLGAGHPPLGALGYVAAAREILTQLAAAETTVDEIVVASGSGNTHAGLLFGLRALGSHVRVAGICVRRDAAAQRPRIGARCSEIAEFLDLEIMVTDDDVVLDDRFLSPGYGQMNDATVEAMKTAAHSEGLILDPVYSGKAMAGFLERARTADSGRSLLFLHTGGTPATFAYVAALTDALA
jgi:D-cysteine desulfhydrase family pyridoxal phosphate-dependent enzyme